MRFPPPGLHVCKYFVDNLSERYSNLKFKILIERALLLLITDENRANCFIALCRLLLYVFKEKHRKRHQNEHGDKLWGICCSKFCANLRFSSHGLAIQNSLDSKPFGERVSYSI